MTDCGGGVCTNVGSMCDGCLDRREEERDAQRDSCPDTLLGIPDFDDFESQAETGQGPPA